MLTFLPSVKVVNLSRNELSAFPQGGPSQFAAAVSINMEHNTISKIPFGIFSKATGLTKLNLKENDLTSMPLGETPSSPETSQTWAHGSPLRS